MNLGKNTRKVVLAVVVSMVAQGYSHADIRDPRPPTSGGSGTRADPFWQRSDYMDDHLWKHEVTTTTWTDNPGWQTHYPIGLVEGQLAEGEYEVFSTLRFGTFSERKETATNFIATVVVAHEMKKVDSKANELVEAWVDATKAWYDTILVRGYYKEKCRNITTPTPGKYSPNARAWIAGVLNKKNREEWFKLQPTYDPENLNYSSFWLTGAEFEEGWAGAAKMVTLSSTFSFRLNVGCDWTFSVTMNGVPKSQSGPSHDLTGVPVWIVQMAQVWPFVNLFGEGSGGGGGINGGNY